MQAGVLEFAQPQGAFTWELRTSISAARAHRDEGRSHDALEILHSIGDSFLEGFSQPDPAAAWNLLSDLRNSTVV